MSALVSVTDVEVRLATTYAEGGEWEQVAALCDDVSALIRSRLPLVDPWIADGLLSTDTVVAVGAQVVARALTSVGTGGVGVRSETHPEYGYELTSTTAAGLSLTRREVTLLTPVQVREHPFTVTPAA